MKKRKNKKIFLIAQKVSADLFAADLIRSFKKQDPSLRIYGVGGDFMQKAGCEMIYNLSHFVDINQASWLQKYFFFRKLLSLIIQWLKKNNVQGVIVVHSSEINIRLGKKIKSLGIPLFYYVAPSMQRLKKSYISAIKKYADVFFVFFPFEKYLYHKAKIKNIFAFGHPFFEKKKMLPFAYEKKVFNRPIIAFFPGSSEMIISQYLPIMIKTKKHLLSGSRVVISAANDSCLHHIQSILKKYNKTLKVPFDILRDKELIFKKASFCVVVSQTMALECFFRVKPFLILHQTSSLRRFFQKKLSKREHLFSVNYFSQKKMIPELISGNCRPLIIGQKINSFFKHPHLYDKMFSDMQKSVSGLKKSNTSFLIVNKILSSFPSIVRHRKGKKV